MPQNTLVQNNATKRLAQNWRDGTELFKPYLAYGVEFIDTLIEFQLIWDGHIDHIGVSKHWTNPLDGNTKPVHSAPYKQGQRRENLTKLRFKRWSKKTKSRLRKRKGMPKLSLHSKKMAVYALALTTVELTQYQSNICTLYQVRTNVGLTLRSRYLLSVRHKQRILQR